MDCNFPYPNLSPLCVYFSRLCLRLDRLHEEACGHQESRRDGIAPSETSGCVIDIDHLGFSLIGLLIGLIFFPLCSCQFHVSVDPSSKSLLRLMAWSRRPMASFSFLHRSEKGRANYFACTGSKQSKSSRSVSRYLHCPLYTSDTLSV